MIVVVVRVWWWALRSLESESTRLAVVVVSGLKAQCGASLFLTGACDCGSIRAFVGGRIEDVVYEARAIELHLDKYEFVLCAVVEFALCLVCLAIKVKPDLYCGLCG